MKMLMHGDPNETHTGHGAVRSVGSGATMLAVVVPIGSLCMQSVKKRSSSKVAPSACATSLPA